MRYKKTFILVSIIVVIGLVSFFIFNFHPGLVQNVLPFTQDKDAAALLRLHPLASDAAIKATHTQNVDTWEEWIDARTEAWLGVQVLHGFLKTKAEIDAKRPDTRAGVADIAERFKPYLDKPPTVGGKPPWHLLPGVTSPIFLPPKKYEGPQTVEGLTEAFDAKYVELYPDASEYDAYYPRSEWIQMLLDKGMQFENRDDYNVLLNIRGWVINAESRPEWWTEGKAGVTPTDNFETYKNAYIERQMWQQEVYKRVTIEDPTATGVRFFDDRPDKYLVSRLNTLYVNRDGPGTRTWGTGPKAVLTEEQYTLLIEEGIHPEGLTVIYVDNDYNILSEKPPPFDRDAYIDSQMTNKQREEEKMALEMFGEIVKKAEADPTFSDRQFWGTEEVGNRFDVKTAEAIEAAAREAAKSEYEKFAGRMRQLESFSTMSDTEIEKQLERQFRKQFLPEHPIEQLEQITPERLERALGTLFQHGFEDGMRMIRKDNAALADTLERHFGKRAKPPAQDLKPPQRPAPPKPPSEPPAASDETQ